MANLVEIYKCGVKHGVTWYSALIYSIALLTFIISVGFNIFQFVRYLLRKQPKSTFNPIIANTTALCYCASLKALGKFCDKFTISYYGFLKNKKTTATKAIAFMKLIFEDCIQLGIQIAFLRLLKEGDYTNVLAFSIVTSSLSILMWLYTLRSDTSSKLSNEQIEFVISKILIFINIFSNQWNILIFKLNF